jgi:hypothetical protein
MKETTNKREKAYAFVNLLEREEERHRSLPGFKQMLDRRVQEEAVYEKKKPQKRNNPNMR